MTTASSDPIDTSVTRRQPAPCGPGQAYIRELDGLRAIAVGMVMLVHINRFLPVDGRLWHLVHSAFAFGWTGVDLFFALSGYLITGIILDTCQQRGWWRRFMARRALRILPLYYSSLLIYWICWTFCEPHRLQLTGGPPRGLLLHFFTFTENFGLLRAGIERDGFGQMVFHYWSLAVEQQFYLIFPLVLAAIPKARVGVFLVVLCGGAIVSRFLVWGTGIDQVAAYVLLPCRMDALALGAAVAWVARCGALGRSKPRHVLFGCLSMLVLGIVIWGHGATNFTVPMQLVGYTVTAALSALIVAEVAASAGGKGIVARVLRSGVFVGIGRISYGMYIYNSLFVWVIDSNILRYTPATSVTQAMILVVAVIALTILAAWTSFTCLEKPILRLKEHLT